MVDDLFIIPTRFYDSRAFSSLCLKARFTSGRPVFSIAASMIDCSISSCSVMEEKKPLKLFICRGSFLIPFAAVGGAAALMAQCVASLEVIAWDDLGPESVKRLTVRELPLVVAVDCYGEDAFAKGQKAYLDSLK